MDHTNITLEEEIAILLTKTEEKKALTVKEVVTTLSGKGRALILLFLVLPFSQPIQIPGFSIPFGIIIFFIGIRMAFGKRIWLPKFLLKKKIASPTLQKMAQKTTIMMKKTKRFIRPRILWLSEHDGMQIVNGMVAAFLGLMLAAPIPVPLTNIPVSWALIFLCLGLLKNDGIFILVSYFVSLFALIFFIFLLFSLELLTKYL